MPRNEKNQKVGIQGLQKALDGVQVMPVVGEEGEGVGEGGQVLF